MISGFHTQEGLYFSRNEDGSVTITKTETANTDSKILFQQTVDENTWCSVIASMSKDGEGDNRFYIAKVFHESDNNGLLSFLNEQAV